ncbi:MAG: hypothetical protein ACRECD_02205 [Burkholderiaceae bacterium]
MKKLALAASLGILIATPMLSHAESTFVSGAGATTASARLDFSIVIPKVLYVRVGTGTNNATNATVDLINFTVPAANLGDATVINADAASGDLTNGAVTVRIYGNGGNINLNSATTGPMTTGTAGEEVSWSRVTVTPAALASTTAGFTNGAITHPAFNTGASGGAGTATTLTATNKVVRQEGQWSFAYANQDVVAAGTYGGTVARNGRVTYTVTQP